MKISNVYDGFNFRYCLAVLTIPNNLRLIDLKLKALDKKLKFTTFCCNELYNRMNVERIEEPRNAITNLLSISVLLHHILSKVFQKNVGFVSLLLCLECLFIHFSIHALSSLKFLNLENWNRIIIWNAKFYLETDRHSLFIHVDGDSNRHFYIFIKCNMKESLFIIGTNKEFEGFIFL